jgi:hypothetical protein
MHDMIVAITVLAAQLDHESREVAFSLASNDWWSKRTVEIIGDLRSADGGVIGRASG